MRGIYENIEYIRGIKESFIYIGTMQGYNHLPPVDLFNGWKTDNTISRNTLEKLLEASKC